MMTGLVGISDLVKRQALGKKEVKLKFDLLVAIQQDWDALRHSLHALASPKHQQKMGFTHGQKKTSKSQGSNPKIKLKRGERSTQACCMKSLD